jgi:hypothetical protein
MFDLANISREMATKCQVGPKAKPKPGVVTCGLAAWSCRATTDLGHVFAAGRLPPPQHVLVQTTLYKQTSVQAKCHPMQLLPAIHKIHIGVSEVAARGRTMKAHVHLYMGTSVATSATKSPTHIFINPPVARAPLQPIAARSTRATSYFGRRTWCIHTITQAATPVSATVYRKQ